MQNVSAGRYFGLNWSIRDGLTILYVETGANLIALTMLCIKTGAKRMTGRFFVSKQADTYWLGDTVCRNWSKTYWLDGSLCQIRSLRTGLEGTLCNNGCGNVKRSLYYVSEQFDTYLIDKTLSKNEYKTY